jgi:putative CocE/NonD family hydrolase
MKRAAVVLFVSLAACRPKDPANWDKTETMIPMRDGVRLHTLIYAPNNQVGKLPLLMERSPYGFTGGRPEASFKGRYKQLSEEGFIFVFQDIRGRYESEGEFVMTRAPRDRSKANSIDEATDASDTVDWLIKNVPNHNGRAVDGLLRWR